MDVDSYASAVRLYVVSVFVVLKSECEHTSPVQDLSIYSVSERLFSFLICVSGDPANTPTLLNVSR